MRRAWGLLICLLLPACASPVKNIQPQINSLIAAERPEKALSILGDSPLMYGSRNELLYWLDKGLVAQLAGQYEQSIATFEKAKKKYDELYTQSIRQIAASWAVNDYAKDYKGSDDEYVLLYLMQSFNFAVLGKLDEALVDARAVDYALNQINGRYPKDTTNAYSDDAFARFWAGILWQESNSLQGLNDAHIAYTRAMVLYPKLPDLLKENFELTRNFMDTGHVPHQGKARVYVIEYTGYVSLKVSNSVPIPLDAGNLTKISFPSFSERVSEVKSSLVVAVNEGREQFKDTQVVKDIGQTARLVLESHKASILAKAVIRPLVKYAAQKTAEEAVRREYGDLPAGVVTVLADFYNLATEEADLRSWQTLPNEIRLARLDLEPGEYDVFVEDLDENKALLEKRNLGHVELKSGEVRFFLTRGYR